MQPQRAPDLARTIFQILALGILIAMSFRILQPFLLDFVWALTIVVATWQALLRLEGWFGGRRGRAVAVMTTLLLLTLVLPLSFGVHTIVGNAERIAGMATSLATASLPVPPTWAESVPLLGPRLAERWREIAAMTPEQVASTLSPYVREAVLGLVRRMGTVGVLIVHFLVTVVIAAILYAKGEIAADGARRFAHRLAGRQGVDALLLSGQAIRSVAMGVVLTAVLQTTLAGLGLLIAGVPFATVLIAITFVLCVAQLGPALVLIPAVVFVYSDAGSLWGTVFLVWAVFCTLLDNFVRPVLIKRGADLPLLLIFAGVIGGLIAFGVIGLFIGPAVLAVAYTLLADWVGEGGEVESTEPLP